MRYSRAQITSWAGRSPASSVTIRHKKNPTNWSVRQPQKTLLSDVARGACVPEFGCRRPRPSPLLRPAELSKRITTPSLPISIERISSSTARRESARHSRAHRRTRFFCAARPAGVTGQPRVRASTVPAGAKPASHSPVRSASLSARIGPRCLGIWRTTFLRLTSRFLRTSVQVSVLP